MSEDNQQSFKDFLAQRKINIDQLEQGEKDKFDLEEMEARHIEETRLRNFPISNEETQVVEASINYNLFQHTFTTCLDM